ncbi:hypothetical protein Q5752_002477 [Cryptotrichosporon argae]
MRRRTAREAKGGGGLSAHGLPDYDADDDSGRIRGGVCSGLLERTGRSNTMRRRPSAGSRAPSTGGGEIRPC